MLHNPFDSSLVFENDPEDFKLPYQLQSRCDVEVMQVRYNKLRKASYGYLVRLGIPEPRQW